MQLFFILSILLILSNIFLIVEDPALDGKFRSNNLELIIRGLAWDWIAME